jgi:hypothetical protein
MDNNYEYERCVFWDINTIYDGKNRRTFTVIRFTVDNMNVTLVIQNHASIAAIIIQDTPSQSANLLHLVHIMSDTW